MFLASLFQASTPEETQGLDVPARAILERSAERVEELAKDPLLQARALYELGSVYNRLNSFEESPAIAAARPPPQTDFAF